MRDVSPKTHFLESIRRDKGSYATFLSEAIDNSFDAGASRIDIEMLKDKVSVADNGVGIARKYELAIVTFGDHRELPSTSIGRFGMGVKYQAVSAANRMNVRSISADGRMTQRVNWQSFIASGKWEVDDPNWDVGITSPTGTLIEIRDLRWKMPNDTDIERARQDLSQLFQPALVSGMVITINKERLPSLNDPDLSSVVHGEIDIGGKTVAIVHGGILVDPKSPLYQVHVGYRHRVILARSSFGCRDAGGGLRHLFARVQLQGDCELSRFKDDIAHDPRYEELSEKVEAVLRPILDKCREESLDLSVQEMEVLLNAKLPKELRPARPEKKNPAGKRGKKRGKLNGKTKSGEDNANGPARKLSQARGVKIAFEDIFSDYGFGRFERIGRSAKTGRIVLAKDNPHIKHLISNRDKRIATESLYQIAIGLYLHERNDAPEAPGQLPLQGNGFAPYGKQWCNLFSSQVIADA